MKRSVQPELLDMLSPDDPRAIRSRRDLRRVNALMRNSGIMARALQKAWPRHTAGHVTELGAGDGNFLLRVAQRLSQPTAPLSDELIRERRTPLVTATLLDLKNIVAPETIAAFAALGWSAEPVVGDAFDWLRSSHDREVVIANLFLHHFDDTRLTELLRLISQSAKLFVAIEPRRAMWPLFCSRLLWTVGCNGVTRHDAAISVGAGFCGNELSARWPATPHWHLEEHCAGAFSHLFIAKKFS